MMAFKETFHQAEPHILEPVYEIQVMVPETDGRRGHRPQADARSSSAWTAKKYQVIKARAPGGTRQVFHLPGSITGPAATPVISQIRVPGEIQRKLAEGYKATGSVKQGIQSMASGRLNIPAWVNQSTYVFAWLSQLRVRW